MAIEELLALVPSPRTSAADGTMWAAIERAAGARFPSDYRAFAAHYGSGQFDDGTYAFWVFNPLAPDYPTQLTEELDLWRARREGSPWEYPTDIFPSVPGLLPWGHDVDGGLMGWLVDGGDPDRWAVVAKNPDEAFERFDLPMTSFLAQSLSHRLRPRVWRADYPQDLHLVEFQPWES